MCRGSANCSIGSVALAAAGIELGEVRRVDGEALGKAWPEFRRDLEGIYIENIARMDGRRMSRRSASWPSSRACT